MSVGRFAREVFFLSSGGVIESGLADDICLTRQHQATLA
jgi:hypothetical protein